MMYSEMIKKACLIATEAHKDDFDKGGYPYIMHPYHLAEEMDDEQSICVALLHDVVEDHGDKYSFEYLAAQDFPAAVINALKLLTHTKGTSYMDYIKALAPNDIARTVKAADLSHNLTVSRTDGKKSKKYNLYMEALAYLIKYEVEKENPDYER